jgi:hypothetical protein
MSNLKGIGVRMGNTHSANSRIFPYGINNYIGPERDIWAMFFLDFAKPLDGVTGSNFIFLNLDIGWDACFVKHIVNQTNEGAIFNLMGVGLKCCQCPSSLS